MPIDISVSVVNFNTKSLLKNCLESVSRNTQALNIEIIVVDNHSKDDSVQMIEKNFPKVTLIKNSKNLYFTKAYNQAISKSRGKYVLVLNSDTKLRKNSLYKMFVFMEKHPNAAAASCREIDENGNLDLTCSRFPTPLMEFFESNLLSKIFKNKKLLQKYRYANWKRNTTRQVDVIPGSFMFIRNDHLQEVGLFDENLLLFYGENDLCKRLKEAGFDICHNCEVTITHYRSQTIKKMGSWKISRISLHDLLYFYRKHHGVFWWLFLWLTYRTNWLYFNFKK